MIFRKIKVTPLLAPATVSADTRLKLTEIVLEKEGDRISFQIRATILEGPNAGDIVDISPLTNYGFRGFDTHGGGYSPNPLILEMVREPIKGSP